MALHMLVNMAGRPNPGIECIVRSHNAAETEQLRTEQAGRILIGEEGLVSGATRCLLASLESLESLGKKH